MGENTEKMRIEVLERIKHDGRVFDAEDISTVNKAMGEYFCDNGWARDLSGEYPTAERSTTRKVVLSPDKINLINGMGTL